VKSERLNSLQVHVSVAVIIIYSATYFFEDGGVDALLRSDE
jgi:hypothetical protein